MGFATVSVFPLGDTPALLSTRLHQAGCASQQLWKEVAGWKWCYLMSYMETYHLINNSCILLLESPVHGVNMCG